MKSTLPSSCFCQVEGISPSREDNYYKNAVTIVIIQIVIPMCALNIFISLKAERSLRLKIIISCNFLH